MWFNATNYGEWEEEVKNLEGISLQSLSTTADYLLFNKSIHLKSTRKHCLMCELYQRQPLDDQVYRKMFR